MEHSLHKVVILVEDLKGKTTSIEVIEDADMVARDVHITVKVEKSTSTVDFLLLRPRMMEYVCI